MMMLSGFATMEGQTGDRQTAAQKYIDIKMQEEPFKSGLVGVLAVTAKGDTIAEFNSSRKLIPASNTKLITTGLAIKGLGKDYRLSTALGYDGDVSDGVLRGDLYIVGGGDPTLASSDPGSLAADSLFSVWKSMLTARGIRRIDGRIIGDGRYLDGPIELDSWAYNDLGTFSANDIALQATLGYELARNLSGGITLRGVYGSIGSYNSLAVAADLGLNLYIPESEWSVGIVAKNLGGQIKAYDEDFEKMPLDLQVGVSKRLIGSPLRLSLTLVDLNHTGYSLKDHMVIGAEALLSDQIYVAGGYNFRRAHDMKVYDGEGNNSSHGAGLSFGVGVNLERVKINIAYSKLHVSASTLIANIAFTL